MPPSRLPLLLSQGAVGLSVIACLLAFYLKDIMYWIDNINNYYSVQLKRTRLARLVAISENNSSSFVFGELDISDKSSLFSFLESHLVTAKKNTDLYFVNLAAQAGVRYSITNPDAYIESNIVGFSNVIQAAKVFDVNHFLYASSSSVYGRSDQLPNKESDRCDMPLSLYAATKRSNELIAYSYSSLYKLRSTGLRFFTAYGPWGRPDMALYLFSDAICNNQPIQVFNNGQMIRDFTYIDDLVESLYRLIYSDSSSANSLTDSDSVCFELFNIGNSQPRQLMDYISILEKSLGRNAIIDFKPMQLGDSPATQADTSKLNDMIGFVPTTPIEIGIKRFVDWYLMYKSS